MLQITHLATSSLSVASWKVISCCLSSLLRNLIVPMARGYDLGREDHELDPMQVRQCFLHMYSWLRYIYLAQFFCYM